MTRRKISVTQHLRREIVLRRGEGQGFRTTVSCGRTLREHRQSQEPGDGEFRKRQHEPQVPRRLQRRQSDQSPGPGGRVANQTQESQFAADLQQGAAAVLLPTGTFLFR